MEANLRGIYLGGVDFTAAVLTGTDFTGSTLNATVFGENYLDDVIGLDSVIHNGPSVIGIETIYLSEGKIPEMFLRGCGVPESLITQMRALVASAEPIQFYTCFISFTEADDPFSELLYTDLQSKGVRCWRWKEDARWGKTLMRSVDEAVRVYDKLIVICSEQSLNSPPSSERLKEPYRKRMTWRDRGKTPKSYSRFASTTTSSRAGSTTGRRT